MTSQYIHYPTSGATPGGSANSIQINNGAGGLSGSSSLTFDGTTLLAPVLNLLQVATPSSPAAGRDKLYFKSDDKLYGLNSAGVEVLIGPAAASGANVFLSNLSSPTAINQDLNLGANNLSNVGRIAMGVSFASMEPNASLDIRSPSENGDLGIAFESPSEFIALMGAPLTNDHYAVGSIANQDFVFRTVVGAGKILFATGASGNISMSIDGSSGFVGIGTLTPTETLEVVGNIKVAGQINNVTDPTSPQDAATKAYVDASGSGTILVFTSVATVGGAASEALTVTGLLAADTILSVSQKTGGGSALPILGWSTQANNAITGIWSADPGSGAVVLVAVKR